MTDFAKHIEVITEMLRPHVSEDTTADDMDEALTAAIELMRAATPKDAKAERELVQQVAAEIPLAPDLASRIAIRNQILDLRAAARAEGYAQADAAANTRWRKVCDKEIELNGEDRDRAEEELTDQLTAAQAEIARLRAENAVHEAFIDSYESGMTAFETKLTNLRAAVTEHLANTPKSHAQAVESDNALRAAVEASRA